MRFKVAREKKVAGVCHALMVLERLGKVVKDSNSGGRTVWGLKEAHVPRGRRVGVRGCTLECKDAHYPSALRAN